MADIILHAEPYGSLLLASEVPCVIIAWHGFANSEQFRFLMNRGLELYQAETAHTQPLGWLADTHDVQAVKPIDQEWMRNDWNPRAFAAGIRHVSFVVPETVFGQISVQNYTQNTAVAEAYELELSQHETLRKAKNWLKKAIR